MDQESITNLHTEAINLISESSRYGNLGLFIGAGMSKAILNEDGEEVALGWGQLIERCAAEFEIDILKDIKIDGKSFPEIASQIVNLISQKKNIENHIADTKLKQKIAEITAWYPTEEKRKLFGPILENINPNWIITTNYDSVIECLLTGKSLSLSPTNQLISPENLIPVYHLHGIRTDPSSFIITQEDYVSLFRPNQYRQQKLSLSIKESTTVLIGYGLGDVNVLTAVDWSKNVYSNQKINYPHDIIQLFYCEDPKTEPYRDKSGILIIEYSNLYEILNEISITISKDKELEIKLKNELAEVNKTYSNPSEALINKFIDDPETRSVFIQSISEFDIALISGFLELFSRAIDETWKRAQPYFAFEAYNENLILILDVIEKIKLENLPPALLESIAYNLNRVAYYVGSDYGKSYSANKTWQTRKVLIPLETKDELLNMANAKNYNSLIALFNR